MRATDAPGSNVSWAICRFFSMLQRRRNLTSFNACFEVSTYPLVDTNLGVHECHHLYSPSPRPDGPRMTLTLEKRLQLYVEATTAAATIATSKDVNEVAKAKEQFLRLNHGPMKLVQDFKVWLSMGEFEACMEDKSKCQSSLVDLSDKLAINCANSSRGDFAPGAPADFKVTIQ